ncbi:MAG: Rab family GTPase [Promethearchaeota archaeon]|jgi:Ras-related protein Rab-1A
MSEGIIKAIVYTSLDEKIGPNPLLWFPLDLSEEIRMGVSIKTITMLITDQGAVPDSLVIMPFPSFGLKGVIKYVEREDKSRRGGVALSSIALLFDEANDLIFYKYLDYFKPVFAEVAKNLVELEKLESEDVEMYAEINKLRKKLSEILDDLRYKEQTGLELEAFPEDDTKDITKFHFKVVVCGDPGVGKTSTILRLTDNAFIRTYIPTLGVSVSERKVEIKDKIVNLIFWDIAGQSKFALMRRHFYQGADGVILVFDITNKDSFLNIENWFKEITKHLIYKSKLVWILLGNKKDLINNRIVNRVEAEELARNNNLTYLETSALTGNNVEESFYKLAETFVKSKDQNV